MCLNNNTNGLVLCATRLYFVPVIRQCQVTKHGTASNLTMYAIRIIPKHFILAT